MITIFKSEIHSTKKPAVFKTTLEAKTLKTSKMLSIMNTVNMTSNDKDFYGKYEKDTIAITRIRRISLLRFLPKLIITFPEIEKSLKFHVKLGFFSLMALIFLGLALIINISEFVRTSRFTEDFLTILIFIGVFFSFVLIELMMYKQKFNNY
ncbi:hypothetical protein [uncultured Kordia sp.]|uniref:hypothetical protein n=1 Tax=uncultured Kordia sp. TaxID=507699 RepID=UPI0026330EB5|nr:hypothetical protein [uncultured Kordia sp.]